MSCCALVFYLQCGSMGWQRGGLSEGGFNLIINSVFTKQGKWKGTELERKKRRLSEGMKERKRG